MPRNPDRNFSDYETGIKIFRAVDVSDPLLVSRKKQQLQEITLNTGHTRLIEHIPATNTGYKSQQNTELGNIATEYYIVYFDYVDADHLKIQKGDLIYFNRGMFGLGVVCDVNAGDVVKLKVENIPMFDGLSRGNTGVDCGMCEVECISF